MTIAEQKAACETYQGMTEIPTDFEAVWRGRGPKPPRRGRSWWSACLSKMLKRPINSGPSLPPTAGRSGQIHPPAREGAFPTVLMFHDLGRGFEAGTT